MTGLEGIAMVTGMFGAVMMALNVTMSKWGLICFLLSAVCWIFIALKHRMTGLLWMNSMYLLIDIIGIARWF